MAKEDPELQHYHTTIMEWTVHPIRRNWKISFGIISLLVILNVAIYSSYKSITFLLVSATILFGSLSQFFFPTTYILQSDCIIVRSYFRRFSRRWNFFKSYYPDKNGVLLSPFTYPSRLENFRGLYVKFNHNRAEVLDFVESKIGE